MNNVNVEKLTKNKLKFEFGVMDFLRESIRKQHQEEKELEQANLNAYWDEECARCNKSSCNQNED